MENQTDGNTLKRFLAPYQIFHITFKILHLYGEFLVTIWEPGTF